MTDIDACAERVRAIEAAIATTMMMMNAPTRHAAKPRTQRKLQRFDPHLKQLRKSPETLIDRFGLIGMPSIGFAAR
jgi:hypothetical protein